MPTNTPTTHYVFLTGSDDGTTFGWTSKEDFSSVNDIIDQNDDNNLDIDTDNFGTPVADFTGFYYTALNGNTYPVFQSDLDPTLYYIPYNKADYDLFADVPAISSLTDKSDNFVPTGVVLICFAAGSLIATPDGETAVEELAIGDRVVTQAGRTVVVKWIGRQTVQKLLAGPRMQPVRIRAGALGEGLPHSDLTVTADHGMIIDGLVINASALVNGTTIDWVPMGELADRVTYYHVETEDHDVILANGAPTETFVDILDRMAFDNHQEYLDLYGAERIIPEMERPRISSQRLLPDAVKAKLGIIEQLPGFDTGLGVAKTA